MVKRGKVTMNDIPDSLIGVLTRLPAKSIMRFKCVCKQWCSLLCDPYFVKLHYAQSKTRRDGVFYLISYSTYNASRYFFYVNLERKLIHQLILPFPMRDYYPTNIVRNIVCYYGREHDHVSVCNFTTREVLTLPASSTWNKISKERPCYALGFDPVKNEYKVLKICTIDEEGKNIGCEIFTLGTNSWRKIKGPPCHLMHYCLCVNGILFWEKTAKSYTKRITVTFDVGQEKFRCFPLPEEISRCSVFIQIGEFMAAVCLNEQENPHSMHFWILKDYFNWTWTKMTITVPDSLRHLDFLTPSSTDNFGNFFLMAHEKPLPIVHYDIMNKDFMTIDIPDLLPFLETKEDDHPRDYEFTTMLGENLLPLRK